MGYFLEDLLFVDPSGTGLKKLTISGKLNWTGILSPEVKEQKLKKKNSSCCESLRAPTRNIKPQTNLNIAVI